MKNNYFYTKHKPEKEIREIILTTNWSAYIDFDTYKLPPTLTFVLILSDVGENEAVNDEDANLSAVFDNGKFVNPLPSPLNEPEKEPVNEPVKLPLNDVALPVNEPVNCPVTLSKSKLLTNPLLPWSSETTIAGEPDKDALKLGTPKFGSA